MAYVELEKARELLFKFRAECIDSGVKEHTTRGILYSINELSKLPTADVEEVKHGEWQRQKNGFYFVCSACGKAAATKGNYCHSCGAKMDR